MHLIPAPASSTPPQKRMRRTLAISIAVISAFVAMTVYATLRPSVANAAACTTTSPLSIAESTLRRVALNIRESHGKPTPAGAAIIAGAASGDHSSLGRLLGTEPGVSSVVTATNARPWINPSTTSGDASVAPTRPSRSLAQASKVRPLGSTQNYYYYCGPSIPANAIWYCKQGSSSCITAAQFYLAGFRSSNAGGCSIVNNYPCQVYSRAIPTANDWVVYMWFSQTASGVPVVGDRWCG